MTDERISDNLMLEMVKAVLGRDDDELGRERYDYMDKKAREHQVSTRDYLCMMINTLMEPDGGYTRAYERGWMKKKSDKK